MARKSSGIMSARRRSRGWSDARLYARKRKTISALPSHAQNIYRKAHMNALKQYKNPFKETQRQAPELGTGCV